MKKILLIAISVVFASIVMNANEVDSILYLEDDYALGCLVVDSVVADSVVVDSVAVDSIKEDPKSQLVIDATYLMLIAPTDVIALDYEERFQVSKIAENDTLSSNVFYGDTCRVIRCDSAYMEFDVAPNLKYQLVLLKDNLIMVVTTHLLPQQDSEVAFYDFDWNQLPLKKYFKTPLLSDWLTNDGKKNRAVLEKKLPFLLVKYYYDVDTNVLTLTNNLHTYFIASDWAKISPYMKSELKYKWNGKKFNKIK